ncbi:YpiF family protein [Ornithinibacillus halophilus]|uniref:DUF2487 domain-containing protein n=1 Tax=Ornithinibacillus halophilus TaxID=930117 RepID=A0A1M5CPA2_9BACI|nr:YpiF family protein [Ornithinibacillus halophilus]SHF56604.1 Protein of unknown function [Ornithinibacillus halophilus]
MRWVKDDIQTYKKGKEYFDTVIVPVIPFHLSQDAELDKSTSLSEVMNILAHEIEKELSGRVLLIPGYHYIKQSDKEEEVKRINSWVEDIQKQPFNHIFFLTFDPSWKKYERELEGNLLWLPGIQSDNIHSDEMHSMIRNQVAQIGELIRSYW